MQNSIQPAHEICTAELLPIPFHENAAVTHEFIQSCSPELHRQILRYYEGISMILPGFMIQ